MRLLSRRSRSWRESGSAAHVLAAMLFLVSPLAHADAVRVEQVGSVGVGSGRGDLRQAAVEFGIGSGVLAVAREVAGRSPEGDSGDLRAALGRDLVVYAERFRVLEDRGREPVEDKKFAGGERYSVLVEVYVDRDRVASRLREQGVLDSPAGPRRPADAVSLEVRFIDSYADLEALKASLVDRGIAESVIPRAFERGRARLRVTTHDSPAVLAARLLESVPPELGLRGVRVEGGTVIVDLAP